MKTKKNLRRVLLLLLSSWSLWSSAQSLTFNVTTVTYNGGHAPNNCFVVYVTKSSTGAYINTLTRLAQLPNYGTWLTNWKGKVGTNWQTNADGVTGASCTSHYAHTVTWNCKDASGNIVPDGTYKINIEFTETNATGKYTSYTFTKGTTNQSQTFTDATYFKSASLTYTAPTTGINEINAANGFKCSYSKASGLYSISFDNNVISDLKLKLYDIQGRVIKTSDATATEGVIVLKTNGLSGSYIIKLIDKNGKSFSKKVVL